MSTIVQLCFGIVLVGCVIGILVGYTLVAAGISDALGPFFALICFFTIVPIILFGPLGIGTNPKITLGFQFIGGSILVILALSGIVALVGKL